MTLVELQDILGRRIEITLREDLTLGEVPGGHEENRVKTADPIMQHT